MNKAIGAFLLLLASSVLKGFKANQGNNMDLARLKASLMYVRSIKTFRLLFLSLLSMGVCLIFLLAALILFHVSLFLYTPWSMGTKMLVGLSCSLVYLLAALAMFSQIFASDKWLKIFHADTIIDQLNRAKHDRPDRSLSETA